MSAILLAILKVVGPAVAAPIATALAKWLAAQIGRVIPAAYVPAVSAAAGALAAGVSGDIATAGAAAVTVTTGIVAGLAGSKARDIATGKNRAVTGEDVKGVLGME